MLARLPQESLPVLVFVTAYDQYAIRAFEARAVDYLLKPIDDARFEATLTRVREHVRARNAADQPAADAADQDVGGKVLLGEDAADADAGGKSVDCGAHEPARILITDDRGHGPGGGDGKDEAEQGRAEGEDDRVGGEPQIVGALLHDSEILQGPMEEQKFRRGGEGLQLGLEAGQDHPQDREEDQKTGEPSPRKR